MDSPSAHLYTNDDVYLGVWTNWAHGRIRGATLTLSRRNGGLLTAFLALFVTFVGTRFWRIGCFFIHRYFSSKDARDALCHQQQAILKNAANSTSGLWTLLCACWAWRRNGLAPYRRLLPSIFFAILISMAFAVATIFSSEITTSMGQDVLLKGSNCGSLMIYGLSGYDDFVKIRPYLSQRTALSVAYVQRCYNNNANSRDCSLFHKPRLPWTADRNATCPFPSERGICLSNSRNLHLDSGYIDSDHDLGINSPPGTKFLYRSVADCAPLKTTGYTRYSTVVPSADELASGQINRTVAQYFYGGYGGIDARHNLSYQYTVESQVGPNLYHGIDTSASSDYTLETRGSYSDVDGTLRKEYSNIVPISALQMNATDLSLFFLSTNGVAFTEPSDDLWYAAHNVLTANPSQDNALTTAYSGDEPVRVLGCATRYQYCNPDPKMGHSCTPLAGIFTATSAADALWTTDKQKNFFNASSNSILTGTGGLVDIVIDTGISSLIARHSLSQGFQGPLSNNQWQLEVENWFAATLADLQKVTVEYVTGPTDPAVFPFLRRPQTEEEQLLCRSLKIRSDAVTSFSVLGLSILLGLGGLIILFSVVIVPVSDWLDKWLGKGDYQRLDWAMNDTLQLQRLAHEELGCGTWIGEEFPITAFGEKLAVLDVSVPGHPKLVNPTAVISTDDAKDANDTSDTSDMNGVNDATDATAAADAATTATANAANAANATDAANDANDANDAHGAHDANAQHATNGTDDAALSQKSSHTTADV